MKRRKYSAGILIPIGLILLSFIPIIGATVRFGSLATNAEITASNARFFASPLPILLHVFSTVIYALLGAFQFMPQFRRRRPRWHRWAGRVLIPSALVVALTSLWMTLFYPQAETGGPLLYAIRLVVSVGMLAAIVMGIMTIYQRRFAQHGNWMMRTYAIGMGAGTQVFTLIGGELLFGLSEDTPKALMMALAWAINLCVAELIIRKPAKLPGHLVTA